MRTFRFAAAIAAALMFAAPAFAVQYEIDSAHSSAGFAVKHLVVSTVRGSLGKVTGTADIDPADPTKSSISATIEVAGINTNNADRDAHLQSPDFLDAKQFPTITFQSKSVEKVSDTQYKVTGDLTLRGVTKSVVLDVEGGTTPVTDPWGNIKLGGAVRTRINRQDFGVSFSKTLDNGGLVVANEVDVIIDIELTQKK